MFSFRIKTKLVNIAAVAASCRFSRHLEDRIELKIGEAGFVFVSTSPLWD